MIANRQSSSYSFKSVSLETNSGSPLGAISCTGGVRAFIFALVGALRFAFLAARLATFLEGALAFLAAAAFFAFLDFLAFPFATTFFTGFFAFFAFFGISYASHQPPSQYPLNEREQHMRRVGSLVKCLTTGVESVPRIERNAQAKRLLTNSA